MAKLHLIIEECLEIFQVFFEQLVIVLCNFYVRDTSWSGDFCTSLNEGIIETLRFNYNMIGICKMFRYFNINSINRGGDEFNNSEIITNGAGVLEL